MKEKQAVSEKTIAIDIKLTRGLVVVLSCALVIVALLAYLTLTGERAVASETETAQAASTSMRQYYMTKSTFQGNGALTACAPGYHMASLWEIADPSNLKYNTTLGFTQADSGEGPPTGLVAWVRTGYAANSDGDEGMANCNAWSSDTGSGTGAALISDWTSGTEDVGVWYVGKWSCGSGSYVCCIED